MKIISKMTFKKELLTKSYDWKAKRSTFSPTLWPDILMEYIYEGKKTTSIEEEWVKKDPKRGNKGSTNNMYFSVLRNRFYFVEQAKIKTAREELAKFSFKSVKDALLDYMNSIISENALANDVAKWKEEYITQIAGTVINLENEKLENYEANIHNKKIIPVKITDKDNKIILSEEIESFVNNVDIGKLDKIGMLGEEIIYNMLSEKHNVVWERKVGRLFSRYDMSYEKDGKTIYVEVKSTTDIKSKSMRYFISSGEVDFANKNQDNYQIYFVSGILRGHKDEWINPSIGVVDAPRFVIDQEPKAPNELSITPIKYLGQKKWS